MKILFVTTGYPDENMPQYCVFLEQQARALINIGDTVDVLIIDDKSNAPIKEYIHNGVHCIKYSIRSGKKSDVFLPSSLCKKDFKAIDALIADNYDVVSMHFGGMKILRSIIKICKKHNIPIIQHFHGLNVWREFTEKYKLLFDWYRVQKRHIYPKLDGVVGVSSKVCGNFSDVIKSVPAFTVYNGVDLDRFDYTNRSILHNPLRLICVANLITLKGQDLLIKAVAKLKKRGIDLVLTLVGRGPNEQMLKDLSASLGVSENVVFTGYIKYDEVSKLMSQSDVFIMPSYYEALGCVYLESMSSGLLTVGVKGQGIDEVIIDGKNGFLLEPDSVDSIVEAVCRINDLSAESISSISQNGRNAVAGFTWQKSAVSLHDVYKTIISK